MEPADDADGVAGATTGDRLVVAGPVVGAVLAPVIAPVVVAASELEPATTPATGLGAASGGAAEAARVRAPANGRTIPMIRAGAGTGRL